MGTLFFRAIVEASNNPPEGECFFDSSDHIRYQNGIDVSGHNYNCHRRIVIEKNISGYDAYTVTIYNLDGKHPLWKDNMQMGPKRMRIVAKQGNSIEFRGCGYDETALEMGVPRELASFANYGIILKYNNLDIEQIQLNLYHKDVSIVYL